MSRGRVVAIVELVVWAAEPVAWRAHAQHPIVEWQHVVATCLDPPAVDHPLQPLRLLFRQVVDLRKVFLQVEQRPLIILERNATEMAGDCLPTIHPDGSVTPHLEVLDPLVRRRVGFVKAVGDALAVNRHLGQALVCAGRRFAEQFKNSRHDVGDVMELVPDLTLWHTLWPADDQRHTHAASVGVALVPAQRGVGDLRPAPGHVGPTAWAADVIEPRLRRFQQFVIHRPLPSQRILQHPALVVRDAQPACGRIEQTARPAHARCAVVRRQHDDRVVELPRLLQVIKQPAELRVGVI